MATETAEKVVLLIGDLVQEGVTTKIKSMGCTYIQKRLLGSNPENWESTARIITENRSSGQLVAAFLLLTQGCLVLAASEDYAEAWDQLAEELKACDAVVFVYAGNLEGNWTEFDTFHNESPEEITAALKVLSQLREAGSKILPYTKRRDLTVAITDHLETMERGVLLRLYVPNNRYQADQLASLLRLLESYLRDVESISFAIDTRKTAHGTVYVFSSQGGFGGPDEFGAAITRFENFMQVCENDPTAARQMLACSELDAPEVEAVVIKFSKEFRRLKVDIKHEYERKVLSLRQRMESELIDGSVTFTPLASPSLLGLVNNSGVIQINVTDNSVSSRIETLVNGDIHYAEQDRELMSLFVKFLDTFEAVSMKTSLEELKDESSPPAARTTAKQKIVGFLYGVASKVGDAAVKSLAAYVEGKIKGL